MTSRLRWLLFAGVFAVLSAGALACGEETVTSLESRCADVVCGEGFECDEADGECKCGGMVCAPGEICSMDPAPTCATSLCEFVDCERGQACHPATGECVCGPVSCAENEWCVGGVCTSEDRCDEASCGTGTTCDPEDGLCKCGETVCEANETCVDDVCVADRCAGVSCGSNSVCNPDTGSCHCGNEAGSVCSTGEACLAVEEEGEDGEPVVTGFACAVSSICDTVQCGGGTVCDPEDGSCRCGGVGTAFPACEDGQSCINGECKGGELCAPGGIPVDCQTESTGLTCDPLDGVCKCGGKGGEVCGEGQGCTALGFDRVPTCTPFCTLMATNPQCGRDESCYYDARQVHRTPFCAPEGEQTLDGSCEFANDCGKDLYCTLGEKCAQVCSVLDGPELCESMGVNLECVPFSHGEIFGYCRGP